MRLSSPKILPVVSPGFTESVASQISNTVASIQLARAGTSVGANIHEAQYAQSKKDFVAKLEIALKESNETSYWLKLMYETKRIDIATYQYTEKLCGNIRRLLIASCRTAKESTK